MKRVAMLCALVLFAPVMLTGCEEKTEVVRNTGKVVDIGYVWSAMGGSAKEMVSIDVDVGDGRLVRLDVRRTARPNINIGDVVPITIVWTYTENGKYISEIRDE